MPALLLRHAAVAGRGRGAGERRAAPERLLRLRRERAKAHAGDGDRDFQLDRLLRVARAEHDIGAAALAIAFERIARDRCAEEEQIVEVRQLPLRAGAADVIDAGDRRAADFRQRVVVEGGGCARRGGRVLVGHEASVRPPPCGRGWGGGRGAWCSVRFPHPFALPARGRGAPVPQYASALSMLKL